MSMCGEPSGSDLCLSERCSMSFWTSIFGGQNKTLNSNINNFQSIGGFATNLGEKSLSDAAKFSSDILSGDQSKIAKSLGPEIKTIQDQTQQNKNQTAQFGNRSGGNNAKIQTSGDTARSSINDLVSSLLGKSADSLASIGSTSLSAGMNAYKTGTDLSQTQMDNWSNSILGLGLTKGAGFLEGLGLSKIPGAPQPDNGV